MTIRNQALTGVSPLAMFQQPITGGISQLGMRVTYAPETDAGQAAAPAAPTEEQMLATIAAHGTEPAKVPEPKADEPGAEAEEPGEGEPAATVEGEAPAKPKPSAKDRIDELTREKYDARREADYWKGVAEGRAQPTGQPKAETQPQGQVDDAPPNPDDYVYGAEDAAYDEDRIAYFAQKAVKAALAEREKAAQAEKVSTTYAEKEKAFAAQNADFNEVVVEGAKNKAWSCSTAMDQAILDSDDGPAMAYHLAKNPDESRRIAALPAHQQFIEMGKIAAKVASPPPATAAPTIPPKTVTTAPEPAPTLRGNNGRFEVAADTSDFKSFEGKADAILAGR